MSTHAAEATPCPICGSVHTLGPSSCPLRLREDSDVDARTVRQERLLPDGAGDATTQFARGIPAESTLKPGAVVGEFVVDGYLGAGGMGVVYRATHPLIGKKAVIKVIKGTLGSDAEHVQRFIREARAVNQIGHPNIVDVFSFGTLPDKRPYLVMEWLQGESLAQRLARGRIPMREVLEILEQVTSALDAAHTYGVIHRDLKPDNIYLVALPNDDRALVKLLDFGLAKITEARKDLFLRENESQSIVGTPSYVPPEALRRGKVDHRSDIYTLGVVAFEMMTGRRPFVGTTALDTIMMHAAVPPPSARALDATIPAAVDALLIEMMAKNPAQRPTLSRIRAVLGANPVRSTPPPEIGHEEETTGARTGDFSPMREQSSQAGASWHGAVDHSPLPELETRSPEPPPDATRVDAIPTQPAAHESSGSLSGIGIVLPLRALTVTGELFSSGDPQEHDATRLDGFPAPFLAPKPTPPARELAELSELLRTNESPTHPVQLLPPRPLRRDPLREAVALGERLWARTAPFRSTVTRIVRSRAHAQRLAIGVGALLLLLIGMVAWVSGPRPPDGLVQLKVRGLPAGAKLKWGDKILDSNPSSVPRSHHAVPLAITCPGYQALTIDDLVPEANLDFSVELQRVR